VNQFTQLIHGYFFRIKNKEFVMRFLKVGLLFAFLFGVVGCGGGISTKISNRPVKMPPNHQPLGLAERAEPA
jgi:hypothetical protein